jgi:hypothetical protein
MTRTTDPTRRAAFAAGVLYLLTFIGSIPGSMLLDPIIADPNYVASAGADGQVALAAVFELVNVLALVFTAVAVFSVVKREHEGLAIGFIATRLFEGAVIAIGVVSVLAVVSLRQAGAVDGTAESLVPAGRALVAIRDWSIILGPGMAAFNALMFGTLLFRSRLVPRALPALGLVGVPLLISYVVGMILGVTGPGTPWQAIAVFPFFFWELGVGLWMTFKGFDRSAPIVQAMIAERAAMPPSVTGPMSTSIATKAGAA